MVLQSSYEIPTPKGSFEAGNGFVVTFCSKKILDEVGLQLCAFVGRVKLFIILSVISDTPETTHNFNVVFLIKVHNFEIGLHVFAIPIISSDGQIIPIIVFVEPIADYR